MSITGSSSIHRLKGVALLPTIADRRRGDGRPRRVIWGEDPVIAVPVFSGRRDEIGEPVQSLFRLQGHPWPLPPWAVAAKATGRRTAGPLSCRGSRLVPQFAILWES